MPPAPSPLDTATPLQNMVDIMSRRPNSWSYEPYASAQHAPYCAQDHAGQGPTPGCPSSPPSYSPGAASYRISPHAGRPAAPAPAQGPPRHISSRAPARGGRQLASAMTHQHPPPPDIYARLSPTYSSAASDQSVDGSERLRQQVARRSSVPHPSPLTPPLRHYAEAPSASTPLPSITAPMKAFPMHHLPKDPRFEQPQRAMHSPTQTNYSVSPKSATPRADRMKISELVDSQSGPASSSGSAAATSKKSVVPPTSPAARSTYRLRVRQQPVAARSCGFGERDRRVIDPPPIVQCFIDDPEASQEEIVERLKHPFAVAHATIWNETGEQDCSAMPEDYRQQRRLMGTVVASPFVGEDENGELGCFFCFPDLSVRTAGCFTLKFSLMVLDPTRTNVGERTPICAFATSERFMVYNAKEFPGMQASTALTKKLKDQGCVISIKKGSERGNPNNSRDDSDDDDGYDDDDDPSRPSGGKRSKRQKK